MVLDEEGRLELEVGLAEWVEKSGLTWVSYEMKVRAGVKLNTFVVNEGEHGSFEADDVLQVEESDAGVSLLCLVVVEVDRWCLFRFDVEVVVGRREANEGAWEWRPQDLSVGDRDAFCICVV